MIVPSLSVPSGCGLANPNHPWEMVYPILVFIGLVLLLIPYAGIMLALVWCFAMLLVVAKDAVRLVHLEIRIRIEYSPRSSGSGTAECGAAELRRTLMEQTILSLHRRRLEERGSGPAATTA
jgi:hypothetical protein